MNKKAQGDVVSTVLLILITVVAAGLIMAFVVPFIRDKLPEENQNCLDVISKVTISSGYTCYNSTNKNQSVQIHIDNIRNSIKGFTIELGGPSSKAVRVLEDDNSGVRMYGGGSFELPNNTEERTYDIPSNVRPAYISVYPVLKNNKVCEASDTVRDVEDC
jgi:flagellin-like protein